MSDQPKKRKRTIIDREFTPGSRVKYKWTGEIYTVFGVAYHEQGRCYMVVCHPHNMKQYMIEFYPEELEMVERKPEKIRKRVCYGRSNSHYVL